MQLLNLFTILPFALAAAGETDDPLITKYPGLVSWFKSHGGIIDPRVTIGYDEKGIRGMISTDTIPKDTLIIQCPGDLVVRDKLESKDHCVSIKSVIEELNAGKESKWHKYFDFDDSSGSRIPSEWGTDMRGIAELQGLPPAGETHRHIDWYRSTCNNGRDLSDIEMQAFKIFITRAADIGLVPMYDLMNHHNGLINTYLRRTEDGKGLDVYALTDIAPNEQIYNTYARSGWESTVDVFNTYGFVEDYPQLWQWSDDELDAKYTANDNHHFTRYTGSEQTTDGGLDEPNSKKFEVLVLSDEIAALYPTKDLLNLSGKKLTSLNEGS